MDKKEIITINGFPGSGKSSTADLVAQKMGYKRFSSGDFMRKIALKRGLSVNELCSLAEKDNEVDMSIDKAVREAGEMKKIVIDSRLAFYWLPESFKVYLDLSPEIAKNRIFNNLKTNKLRQQSEGQLNPEEIFQKIVERFESEKKRYQNLYSVDHADKRNYNLVIDTNKNNLQEVVDIIVMEYKNWLEKTNTHA